MSYPSSLTNPEEAQVHMDLPPDTKLIFGRHASVSAPFGGEDFMRLNIHMLGGEVDLSGLDADSRALINLIYPEPDSDPSANVRLLPNPATDITQVEWLSGQDEVIQLRIIDLQGRLINFTDARIDKGINYIDLSVADMAPGLYFVQILTPSGGRAIQPLSVSR